MRTREAGKKAGRADPGRAGLGIFTHVCVGASDLARAERFYDAALAPLGITNLGRFLDQGV